MRRIGEELGVHPEALRSWVNKAQVDGGLRPGTTTDEAARIREPALEIRELRRANEILRKASTYLRPGRSVSARPADLPVHRDQEGGVWGLADLQGASLAPESRSPRARDSRSQDPPPSARSLRDEALKAEISRVHWYGHHSPSLRHRDAYPRRARSRLGARHQPRPPPPGTITTGNHRHQINQPPQNPGLDTASTLALARAPSSGLPTARGWRCTGQGVCVLHESPTPIEYTRTRPSSPRPSCIAPRRRQEPPV